MGAVGPRDLFGSYDMDIVLQDGIAPFIAKVLYLLENAHPAEMLLINQILYLGPIGIELAWPGG